MVSIIVPVYKVEPYLHRCVNSLLAQTYRDFEIILVDDGSPDACPSICDEYAKQDSRIKVIHQENAGLSAARNKGIEVSKGDYLVFVDSDDWVDKSYCEVLHNMVLESDLAICSHKEVSSIDGVLNAYKTSLVETLDECKLWNEVLLKLNNSSCNKMYKASLVKDLRFPLNLYHGEDLVFNLNYIKKCRNAKITKSQLYFYYKHSGSVTSSDFTERNLCEIKAKDIAAQLVVINRPDLVASAQNLRFRARQNVLRSIYKSNVQNKYSHLVSELSKELNDMWSKDKSCFCLKNKVEFLLFTYLRFLYRIFLQIVH